MRACLLLLFLIGALPALNAQELVDHPRILFPQSEEAAVHKRIKSDPLAADLYKELIRRADLAIDFPTCRYHIPDGKRLLGESRHALGIILHTSMAWRLSGEKKYLDRAVRELDSACALKDWNTSHFLDTGEMSTAVAIGYDWLYHKLTKEQRDRYASALRAKGLNPSRTSYTNKRKAWWTDARNNWAQVCATGLLFAERALEKEGDTIHPARYGAIDTLKKCRKFYTPSGAYPEGPAYWHYGSNYHVLGLALLRSDHNELQLATPPEFKTSPLFTEHLTGPTGYVFNFADASPAKSRITAAQSWMAREFNDTATQNYLRTKLKKGISGKTKYTQGKADRFFPLHLLWLPEKTAKKAVPLPLDSHWHGSQPIATFRTDWLDKNALYFAIKGGYPGASHGQMDVGTFVLESDGIRWVDDLGADNYNMPGYFRDKRWNYFRLTNRSHNTLLIGGKLQNPDASPCPLVHFSSQKNQGTASFDLTSAYQGQAEKVIRTCDFDRENHSVTVTDTINTPEDSVRWAIVTSADIEILGKTAILKKSDKSLRLIRNDDHGGKWVVLDAKPSQDIENQNKGKRILAFTAPAAKQLNLSVTFDRP
ncbi:MAG: heparinase II/III family protein [Akkermansiaceae bacterium]